MIARTRRYRDETEFDALLRYDRFRNLRNKLFAAFLFVGVGVGGFVAGVFYEHFRTHQSN